MVKLDAVSINYLGGDEILTHPLYLKWSQKAFSAVQGGVADLKNDVKGIQANMNNLALISYLSTLLRCVTLIGD